MATDYLSKVQMSNRPQDLTRFRKTYSYRRSRVNEIVTVTDQDTFKNRDLTRFRKMYTGARQQPRMSQQAVDSVEVSNGIITEAGEYLMTEAGENLVIES